MEEAADRIISLLESGRIRQAVFTRFDSPEDPEGTWKNYNEINREVNENAYLNALIPRLQVYAEQYPVYSKSVYSAMAIPEIREAARECMSRGGSLVLTGVVSECCVLSTAFSAIDMGIPVIYIRDACAGCGDEFEAAARTVLSGLDYVQTTILDADDYLNRGS